MGQESQFRRLATGKKTKNSPPIFSQEFIIQNHGDIMSCMVMVVVVGLMFQITNPIAALFVLPQYNVTETESTKWLYLNGPRDMATVFFYVICCIVAHALLQEYIVDKLQRKLHLSKTKTSKFTESAHLAVFSLYAVGHAAYVLNDEGYLPVVSSMWTGYPEQHRQMPLLLKLFFLIQLAFWFHQFPEFFFQKSKRDEMRSRTTYSLIYIAFIGAAYFLNFNRVALTILCLHYAAELVFHVCRMAHFAEKPTVAAPGFKLWNLLFVLVRLACVTLAFLTFWYGLRSSETPHVDLAAGNFNTTFIRLNCLLCVCGLQAWLMWNFITFHLRRLREAAAVPANKRYALRNRQQRKAAKKLESEVRKLPEADQETSRVLRSAKKKE